MLRKGCSVVLGQVFHTPDLLSSANLQVDAAGSALEPSRPRWCWEGPPPGPGPSPADPVSLPANCGLSSRAQQAGPGPASPGGDGRAKVKRLI